jgi:hypothetical protein
MAGAAPPPALPAAVDLDEDIRNRTPSGWPMQARRRRRPRTCASWLALIVF